MNRAVRTVAVFFFAALLAVAEETARAASLFGSSERLATSSDGWHVKIYPLWNRVLEEERKTPSYTPKGEHFNPSDAVTWRNIVNHAKSSSEFEILRTINGFFNHWLPKNDAHTWNTPEYWAAPKEFFALRGGDCEDYAIAKYFALRYLGFSASRMRVVAVRENTPEGKARKSLHAVLAVSAGGTWFILDNNARPRNGISPQSQYGERYIPIYSCNEDAAWVHRKTAPAEGGKPRDSSRP